MILRNGWHESTTRQAGNIQSARMLCRCSRRQVDTFPSELVRAGWWPPCERTLRLMRALIVGGYGWSCDSCRAPGSCDHCLWQLLLLRLGVPHRGAVTVFRVRRRSPPVGARRANCYLEADAGWRLLQALTPVFTGYGFWDRFTWQLLPMKTGPPT